MALPPSWNDMRIRAKEFADYWQDAQSEAADKQTFWNEFFEIFGIQRKTVAVYEESIERLGKSKGRIDLFWPGTLIVEHKSRGESLDSAFMQGLAYTTDLPTAEHPRYIVVSDFRNIKLYDLATTNKNSEWQIGLEELPNKLDLFGFIVNYDRPEYIEQHPVDIVAAKQLTKLHDELRQTGYEGQDLEILLVRLLFCMFAEDNGVFDKAIFHDFIYERTEEHASDLGPKLIQMFEVLNTQPQKRQTNLDEGLQKFPYVNGQLFAKPIATPTFDHKMRYSLLDAARKNDWSQVNPAIFGAMFQNVMQESGAQKRRELGAHYTSELNILKVIKPLFLDDLKAEFEEIKQDRRLLNEFHNKLANLKFLDPACGCGNFLVVSYRELRRLELDILRVKYGGLAEAEIDLKSIVKCNVSQFYGIEIEEFPSQVAQVAMWLTDAQMNNEAQGVFHKPLVRLPLTASASIIHGDALATDWNKIVPTNELNYILGNPPFSGGKQMSQPQRDQIKELFPPSSGAGVLDFVAGWYAKAIAYIQGTDIKVAFVSTNSITQGEQVGILWTHLLEYGAKINFAHRTFKWGNEAGGKAAVYCVIIGFALSDTKVKTIFEYATALGEPLAIPAQHINPYLVDFDDVLTSKQSKPLSNEPDMVEGITFLDNGYLSFSKEEYEEFIKKEPAAKKWIKGCVTGQSLLKNEKRYCLWLVGISPNELHQLPEVMKQVQKVREYRLSSKYSVKYSETPWLTRETTISPEYVVVPKTSSETRNYLPMEFVRGQVTTNTSLMIPGAKLYHFGVLESLMHMTWMRYVAGRLKSDYRYSKDIVYNNFPWPQSSEEQKTVIEVAAQAVLDARANYPDSSLADLYSVLSMPADLLAAHRALDKVVDGVYRQEPFATESDRIKFIFKKYEGLLKLHD